MSIQKPTPAPETTAMFTEAGESAEVVRRQLAANADLMRGLGERLRALKPKAVVTCARGSSDHAATFAKYLIEMRIGAPVSSAALSVTSVYAAEPVLEGALFLAISQSGRSPDLVKTVQAAKDAGAFVIAMVNMEGSPLEALADSFIPLAAGPEKSVAATKSYIASLSALIHLVSAWSEDTALSEALNGLPDLLAKGWPLDWSAGVGKLKAARGLYVIGRGLGYGAAQEAALKLKETSGLHAEAFSAAEVKHGPMAIVSEGFPVLMLAQDDETKDGVEALAADFISRGAVVLATGFEAEGATTLPALRAHPALEAVLFVQSFYRMGAALALARGFDPDRPPHLNKVTETI